MPTIVVHAGELTGLTGMTLELRTLAGVVTNTGGYALTESPASSGRFTATVAEAITETHYAVVKLSSGVVARDGWLPMAATVVQDAYTMPAEDRLGWIMATLHGTISDAQTAAETYVITVNGITFTADYSGLTDSGNRTGSISLSKA